jgi:hypothetical protein
MIILTSSTNAQSLSIIPREYPSLIDISLRNEITNEVVTFSDVSTTTLNGYLSFSNAFSLVENNFYELKILDGSSVIYKDKIFCTDQNIASYSVNDDVEGWADIKEVWNLYNQNWEDVVVDSIYETEDSYDNDYIII